ncbi:MAG: hypothetical protein N2558_02385 [Patescibacteria group bacterium]|nr:hypothetical protein [Patescibacteria group bacterium]
MHTRKFLAFFLFFTNLFYGFLFLFLSTKLTLAQSPAITPTQNAIQNAMPTPNVPCNQVRPLNSTINLFFSSHPLEEFHSMRPYQASPCLPNNTPQSQIALFCGNDIILEDTVQINFQFETGRFQILSPNNQGATQISPTRCTEENLAQNCNFDINRERQISIDLDALDLPVLGNTQNVRNARNTNLFSLFEEIDHAQKMNNYLTWYLGGVTYRAEYFYPFMGIINALTGLFTENPDSFRKVIDYSGPLNKMLPQRIQHLARERQIQATGLVGQGRNSQNQTSFNNPTPRHNQVIICIISMRINNMIIGNVPVPCNYITTGNRIFDTLIQTFGITQLTGLRIGFWARRNAIPPKEEEYGTREWAEYVRDLNEWRGQSCREIRFPKAGEPLSNLVPTWLQGVGVFLCFDNPTTGVQSVIQNPSNRSIDDEFFQHIPMASTEDRLGEYSLQIATDQEQEQPENVTVTERSLTGDRLSSNLYIPHLQQSEELSEIMQSMYVPYDLPKNAPALEKDVFRDVFLSGNTDISNNFFGACQALEYRDGPLGDTIFADGFQATLSYKAQISCTFPLPLENATDACRNHFEQNCQSLEICSNSGSLACAPSNYSCQGSFDNSLNLCRENYICGWGCEPPEEISTTCSYTIPNTIDVNTRVPLLDSIWSRTVAGPTSILRRILPKLGEDSFITQFWDMPGASYASYSSNTTIRLSDFRSGIDPSSAHVYFPHLGGIYHYFLEGLQTSLRPKGFGGRFIPPASTSNRRAPREILSCSDLDQNNTNPNPSPRQPSPPGNQITREQILQIIRNYKLPDPVREATYNQTIRGYQQLYNQIVNNENAKRSTAELLNAERELLSRNYDRIRRYLTTAWIWYETGNSYWPDPYLYNCDDGENSNSISNLGGTDSAWSISNFCYYTGPVDNQNRRTEDFLIQVAGFQATETGKKYKLTFQKIYGSSDETLQEVLKRVVENSSRSSRARYWSYTHPNQNRGLVRDFLGQLQNASMEDILEGGREWRQSDSENTTTKRMQFFTFMLGKDPKMAIYLNTEGANYGGGVTDGSIVTSPAAKQLLSNMIYALWMFEQTMPEEVSEDITFEILPNLPRQSENVCLEESTNIVSGIKNPIISANDTHTYLSYNYDKNAILRTKPSSDQRFPQSQINVGQGDGVQADYRTTHNYIANSKLYYVWTHESKTILFKKAPLTNIDSISEQTNPIVVATNRPSINHPRVAAIGDLAVVVWNEATNENANFVMYSYSTDDGNSWSDPRRASPYKIYGREKPDLAVSNDGIISLVYGGARAANKSIGDIFFLNFNERTKQFDLESLVVEGKGGAFDYANPNHAYSSGKVFVAFRDIGYIGQERRFSRVYVASKDIRSSQNEWNIETISDSTDVWGDPSISVDSLGGIHVFWAGGDYKMIYYTYKYPSGNWSRIYSIRSDYFVANADNDASVRNQEIIIHGVVEEFPPSEPDQFVGQNLLRYYQIKIKR